MDFNDNSKLAGTHAFLSASKPHWLNYDDEKFDRVFLTALAAQRGTELHAFAAEAIRLGVKLIGNGETLNRYVNDAIGFRMSPELILYYSENCYGTADALSFRRNKLRIHDLKTGVTASDKRQLMIYAALFCLEYRIKPSTIQIELRIYQNDEIMAWMPEADEILPIMDRIMTFDKRIAKLKREVL